ncbi:MAG TPA: PAS domain S-box protein [Smithella sp.]|nr:PAS domain S-box protein [Smithella sp.]HPL46664.1 PAS domain S-box protein [Smithella sp.]HPX29587.1 PAS domain S-box protein [Smithella sp.]
MKKKSKTSQKSILINKKTSSKTKSSSKSSPALKKEASNSSKSKPAKTESKKSFSLDRDIHEVIAREWQTAFDAVTDAICLLDKNQRILRSNRAMQDLFAVSGKKIVGKYCWEIIHGTAKPVPGCPIVKSSRSRKPEKMELKTKGRTFNVTAYPVFDEKNTAIIGFVHIINDVTELKQAWEIVNASEMRLKAQYQGSPLAIFIWQKQDKDFVLIDFNKMAFALSQGLVKKFINKTARQLYKKRPDILKDIQDCFAKKTTIKKELFSERFIPGTYIKASYSFVPPDLVMVHIEDISERKQAEAALRESESLYRMLTEKMSDIVWTMDMSMRTTYVSPSVKKVLGFTPKERLRQTVEEQLTPESLAAAVNIMDRELSDEKQGKSNPEKNVTLTLEYYHKNGSTRWLETTVSGLRNEQGKLTGLHGLSRDITQRKRMEDELIESEKKYHSIVDNSTDAILLTIPDGDVLSANAAACKMFDRTEEDIRRAGRSGLMDLSDPRLPAALEERKQTGRFRGELTFVRKDGSKFEGEISSVIFTDRKGTPLTSMIIRDISERKQAEEALKQRDLLFKKLSAHVPGMIYQFVKKPDGTYCLPFSTDAIRTIFGCFPEDVAHDYSPILHAVHPEDVDDFLNSIEYSTQHMTDWKHEYRVQLPDGTVKWMLGQSTPEKLPDGTIVWHGFNADITDQKNIQESLKATQDNYRRLFEDHSAVKLIMDPETGAILDANFAAANYYGWTREEMKQMKISQINILSPDEIKHEMDKVMQEHKVHFEFRHRRADGSIRDVEVYSSRVRRNGSYVLHSIIHDVTERKQAERELKQAQAYNEAILKSIPGSLYLIDENGRLVHWNKQFEILTGYDAHEIQDSFVLDWFKDRQNDLLNIKAGIDTIMTRGSASNVEANLQTKDGRLIPMLYTGVRFDIGGKHHILGVGTDITERKVAEEKLLREEKRFRSFAEQSSDIIALVDKNGTMLYENPAVEKLLGYKQEERIGQDTFLNVHPDDLEDLMRCFQILFTDKNVPVQKTETRIRHKDGTWLTFEISGSNVVNNDVIEFITVSLHDITERKRIQQELLESRNYAEKLLRTANALIVVLDTEGNVVSLNEAGEKITGYRAGDIAGLNWFDLIVPKNRYPYVWEAFKKWKFSNDLPESMENPIVTKSGEERLISWRNSTIIEKGRFAGILAFGMDVTERKKMEESLQTWMRRYELIVAASGQVAYEYTLSTGRIIWGSSIANVLGYDMGEISGGFGQWEILLHPDDRDATIQSLEAAEKACGFWESQYRMKHRKGHYVWIRDRGFFVPDAEGKAYCQLGMLEDITSLKQAEEELKRTLLMNKAILESVPGILYLYNDTGHLVQWNRQFEVLTGYSGDELQGKYVMDWFGGLEPDTSNIKKGISDVMTKGYSSAEARMITKNGDHLFMFFTGVKLTVSGQDYLLGIGLDISERKKAEMEIVRLNESLEEKVQERTRELEAFSYSVSHDLRAPLRTIEGFSLALVEDYSDKLDNQAKDYISRIRRATEIMSELIDDMLKLSRITRTEIDKADINLSNIALTVVDELRKAHPDRPVKVTMPDSLTDYADSRLIKIVLENLLGNAWKFTGKKTDAEIEFGSTQQNGKKVYFVRDNGAGFDMEYVDKIFAPFQRLHNIEEFPGTGIGLATVRRIISRHGGTVWAESVPHQGATFYFTLGYPPPA